MDALPPDLPPDDATLDPLLIERYVAGKCTAAERAEVDRWVAGRPDRHELIDAMRTVWASIATSPTQYDSRPAWADMSARLTPTALTHATSARILRLWPGGVPQASGPARTWRMAAGVAGIGVAGLGAALALRAGYRQLSVPQPVREFATTAGGRAAISLRDGTRILLAPGTHLRVPGDFGRTTRAVALDGEAYFTVVHDAAHPFSVQTRIATATDVGTTFDMRAYDDDRAVHVAVAEGSVSVLRAGSGRDQSLRAGDIAIVTDTATAVAHGADVVALTAWTDGTLRFDAAPLDEVLTEMARWYAIKIVPPTGALATRPFTASLANETAESALRIVAAAVAARLERRGDAYAFVPLPDSRGPQ